MKSFLAKLFGCIVFTNVCSENILAQARYSIVISEIMADPTPQVGLPGAEWIELRNTTSVAINLQGFRITKTGSTPSGPMPNFLLLPDSSVVVCTSSQIAAMQAFGPAVSVTNFPSLGNESDQLILTTPGGATMHAVDYDVSWYKNTVKAAGGWTLEMIDPKNACSGSSNWSASTHSKGGTPGNINAVNRTNTDIISPRIVRATAADPFLVKLIFDEPLDSANANTVAAYRISDGITVSNASPVSPFFKSINLQLNTALSSGKIYTVDIANTITDCSGNGLDNNFSKVPVGIFSPADTTDIVINEILFNPNPQGVDYVELYNRSSKVINLKTLILSNRSSNGQIGGVANLLEEDYPFFPKEYLVITSAPWVVAQQYTTLQPLWLIKPSPPMPSYPNDKGNVVLMNNAGKIVDEVAYTDQMHFALVNNKEGIALERIDYNEASTKKENWTSAASTAGFGTPTAQNSQSKTGTQTQGTIVVSPKIFSPDNDGFDDFALIEFQFLQPGFVANITIMDAAGRPVRILQRNTTCAAKGYFRWDGLNDKQQKVPVGTYIVFTEIFNLQGQRQTFKNTVAVARKM